MIPKKKWTSKRLAEKKEELGITTPPVKEEETETSKEEFKFKEKKNSKSTFKNRDREKDRKNKKKHVVQISNLPNNINVKELEELISPWGEIGRINIKAYSEIICSYVDFYNKYEADYFVEALNSTPFDNLIIGVKIMKFDN